MKPPQVVIKTDTWSEMELNKISVDPVGRDGCTANGDRCKILSVEHIGNGRVSVRVQEFIGQKHPTYVALHANCGKGSNDAN